MLIKQARELAFIDTTIIVFCFHPKITCLYKSFSYRKWMKTVAFVHDRIAQEWGAESVLKDLLQNNIHDEWVIFTYYSRQTRWRVGEKKYRIVTALPRWLNNIFIVCNARRLFFLSTLFDYRNLMFWFPLLTNILRRKIIQYNPDEVIISSFAAVKNIGSFQQIGAATTLYLHSPMQYIRENYEENLHKLRFPIKQFYMLAAQYLRPRDKQKRTYDKVFFNSEYTQKLAQTLYGLHWEVKYPPLHHAFRNAWIDEPENYFIFIGRVVKYVREIDKIIHLFNETREPLLIVGDGPDMGYAQSIAGPTIIFTWQIDDVEEKKKLLARSRGVINIAKESFGLVTAEALCCGVPVFGYDGWATPYLVDEESGVLVDQKSAEILHAWFTAFKKKTFPREKIQNAAQKKFFK